MEVPEHLRSWKSTSFDAKVVLLGDTGVGKTSIALRYCQNVFYSRLNPTIGASFLTKAIVVDGIKIKLQIWDTAGQERFRSLAPMYYRGACAAIVVYDITNPQSFDQLKTWLHELQLTLQEPIVVALVGNKSDLAPQRAVEMEQVSRFGKEYDAIVMEVSAKTNGGIDQLFVEIAKRLNAEKNSAPPSAPISSQNSVTVAPGNPSGQDQGEAGGCC
eukprot:TRINITY_DN1719_c0_g1_i1.p1 TRINITY_DN1719_c0_g1~~TRINITY_DN1719_c0_g1_i1.p1  ORF type:complete len:216 (-),score=45.82 TRINITY_DN1719_c0_g1_i1:218-865(-)